MTLNSVRRNNARIADTINLGKVSVLISMLQSFVMTDLKQPISQFRRFCQVPIPGRDIPLVTITNLVNPLTLLG